MLELFKYKIVKVYRKTVKYKEDGDAKSQKIKYEVNINYIENIPLLLYNFPVDCMYKF